MCRWPRRAISTRHSAAIQAADGRQFSCWRCGKLVVLCRPCDHGNRYCGAACALATRAEKRREAARRYQATPAGRQRHAARQAGYRKRRREKVVTHQGSGGGGAGVKVSTAPNPGPQNHDDTHRQSLHSPTQGPTQPPPSQRWARLEPGQRPCCNCGRPCGPRVRTDRLALSGPRPRSRSRPAWG